MRYARNVYRAYLSSLEKTKDYKGESIMENQEVITTKIIFNGKELTEAEFEVEKKRLQEQNIELVEVKTKEYRTRLHD